MPSIMLEVSWFLSTKSTSGGKEVTPATRFPNQNLETPNYFYRNIRIGNQKGGGMFSGKIGFHTQNLKGHRTLKDTNESI